LTDDLLFRYTSTAFDPNKLGLAKSMDLKKIANSQIARYYLFGLVNNGVGYALFLALLRIGVGAKTSYTALYIVGMTASFLFNRRYVFMSERDPKWGYVLVWATAGAVYLTNIAILVFFVDLLKCRPDIVQIIAMVFISALLFLCNKFIVHR